MSRGHQMHAAGRPAMASILQRTKLSILTVMLPYAPEADVDLHFGFGLWVESIIQFECFPSMSCYGHAFFDVLHKRITMDRRDSLTNDRNDKVHKEETTTKSQSITGAQSPRIFRHELFANIAPFVECHDLE
ncbi:hypothetical protein IV203_013116 [Nitzschia inconspicua]|uniref:Uncharacterized protein n=1 Tax=Nitzschia inconspicua TaxID=303405 RepID=A0A9K3Q7U0_9STRA|nr:hypothetical protein IV203_013116 [Nitzschia inconspicua]